MKKILFVASVYRHLTAFHLPYIKYLQSEGYSLWGSAMSDSGEDKKRLMDLGVRCVDIPFSRSPLSISNIQAYKELKKLLHQEQFSLVHVHTPVASLLTRVAFRNVEYGKIIYTAHGFHFFKGAPKLNWFIYFSAEKLAAKWTDYLITINEEDYTTAHKLLPKNKICYVPGVGVELVQLDISPLDKNTLREELGLRQDSVTIAFIAELNNNKNHQFLLRNWSGLKEEYPNLELLLIGDGEKEKELREFVQTKNLEGVHFLGFRTDVGEILKVSDIATLLSYREGLPKSTMEAMVEGLPCVVTNTRGLRDLVKHDETGFIINHGDDQKLIEAFSALAKSKTKREKMGKQATQQIKPFLLENVLPKYKAIYKDILKEE